MSWEEVALKNTCTFIDGDRGKNYPSNGELLDAGDCLFLSTGNVTSSGFNFESCQFITREKDELLKNGRIQEGDVVITTRGTLGNVAVFTKAVPYKKIRINSGMLILRPLEIVDSIFLYYAICNPVFKSKINAVKTGSAQPQIPAKTLKQLKIPLPPLETQERIVSILSAYDTLIENNRRQIKLLEEAAQRLYKEWFVDLKFPGRESTPIVNGLPEGWIEVQIKDLCTRIQSGSTPSRKRKTYWSKAEISWFKTAELQDCWLFESDEKISQEAFENTSVKLFPAQTILMAIYASPTLGRLGILNSSATFNQAALGLLADEETISKEWLYLKLYELRDEFNAIARGTGQQNISGEIVKNYKVFKPEKKLIDAFTIIVKQYFEEIRVIQIQNNKLREARDRLLPKLMSGEIEV